MAVPPLLSTAYGPAGPENPDDGVTESRIRRLMASRIAIVTFLFILVVLMDIKWSAHASDISIPHFYAILLGAYVLTLAHLLFLRIIPSQRLNIYIQTFCDILMITALVYATGGIRSVYTAFYPLVIIYSVLFLGRNGAILCASGCSIAYGLLIDLEYLEIIEPMGAGMQEPYGITAGYVFFRILVHIFSFYTIAALASFVVEREKQARALLAEKESAFNRLDSLYRSIVESVDTGILTVDLEGRIKSFNRAAGEITGLSFAQVENKNFHDFFPSWTAAFARPTEVRNGQSLPGRAEVPFIRGGTEKLILGCSASALREAGGKKVGETIIFQDLTQIKQMEGAVDKSRRLAFVGEMAASLAHELRNPLASISGSIQMLKRDLSLRVSDERLMEIIIRGKDQLEGFMKDFLLLARHRQTDYENVDLQEVIDEAVDSLIVSEDWTDSIRIEKSISGPVIVPANKAEIRQVFLNLMLNAAQAMPAGGTLSIEAFAQEEPDGAVILKIGDTGIGIDEDAQKRIFEPFYTTKERGTGLGLAIVNRLVEAASGEVTVASRPLEGTTFTVSLPAAGKAEEG